LKQRSVLITGAGSGLGKAIAEVYRHHDFQVIITDIQSGLIEKYASREGFFAVPMDVSSQKDVEACARQVEKQIGHLDVLISNAGFIDFFPVSEAGAGRLKKIFDVNVFGLPNLTKYFLPLLIKSEGRLIVISSESHKVPSPFQPYAVSKQALEKLYESIRIELLTKGIKSVLIRPGAIQTQIMEKAFQMENPQKESVFKNEFENFKRSVSKYIGKISTPAQVAEVVLKAGTVSKPKRVYNINHNPLVTLLSLLPSRLKEISIIKTLKNPDS